MKNITIIIVFSISLFISNAQNVEWNKVLFCSDFNNINDVVTDSEGNLFSIGYYRDTIDFDLGTGTDFSESIGFDMFILKQNKYGDVLWYKTFQNTDLSNSYCSAHKIRLDPYGDILVSGIFKRTVDFDPSSSNYFLTADLYKNDIFTLKLNSEGDFLWANSFGGIGDKSVNELEIDNEGNIYLAGYFYEYVDFDPGTGVYGLSSYSSTNKSAFLMKLDKDGLFGWVKEFESSNRVDIKAMKFDGFGNVYVGGDFSLGMQYDNISNSQLSSSGSFVMKLNDKGNFNWIRHFAGGISGVYSVDVNTNQELIIAGIYSNTVDFDPSSATLNATSNGDFDVFIEKMDSAGNLIWFKTFGGIEAENVSDLKLDKANNIFLTGKFDDTIDFNLGVNVNNVLLYGSNVDSYILMINDLGETVWVQKVGGDYYDEGRGMAIQDYSGSIYCVGSFILVAYYDNDSMTTNSYSPDIYIQKRDICSFPAEIKENEFGLSAFTTATSFQWFNMETEQDISGATNISYRPTENGVYTCKVSLDNCTKFTNFITYNNTSISDLNKIQLIVSPNPNNKGIFSITSDSELKGCHLSIINNLGQKVESIEMTSSNQLIDMSHLNKGIYFFVFKNDDVNIDLKKIIIY